LLAPTERKKVNPIAPMSGMSGAHQAKKQRARRPQSAQTTRRHASTSSLNHHKSIGGGGGGSNNRRPSTASSTRKNRRSGSSAYAQQKMYSRLLERQAEFYSNCKEQERRQKVLDRKRIEVQRQSNALLQSNAIWASKLFCDARNAEAQKRRREAKRVTILEKQVLASRRRYCSFEREINQRRDLINQQRKKQIQVSGSLANINNELNELQHGVNTMLKEAALCSMAMQDTTHKKESQEDAYYEERIRYEERMIEFKKQVMYYTDLSQQNVKKEMESVDKRAAELEEQKQKEKAKLVVFQKEQKDAKKQAALLKQGGPSRFEIQQAFSKIEPYVDNDPHHKVPRTIQYMVKCVIQKIQQYDKSRFDMLKEVQHLQDVAKKHNREKLILEERSKNLMVDFASKQSKTKTQLNALNSVLNRIKTSSNNVKKERHQLDHQVQLVVNRVIEMLEECSHPSVQKYITGSLLGTGSGMKNGGDGDVFGDKNSEGKTTEQVKREKRAALIASMTVNTVLNGFRTVESECLEIINLYWRHQQDHQHVGNRGFFLTQDAEGDGDDQDGRNMNTKSIYPRTKRYTIPYGPAHPHGALSDQLSTSKKSIQSTFPKVKRRNIVADHHHAQLPQQNGVNEPERFMTREELITSTVKSHEALNGGEKVE